MQDSPADDTDVSTASIDADRTAIVVARDADRQPDTTEIKRLAAAAGYTVVDALTQRRREDGRYNLGRGKAEELSRRMAENGVDAVVFDCELTPGQYAALTELLPDETRVIDRHRLVLGIFEAGAGDEAARIQVELARLRYELPRVRETEERTHMQRAAETGSRVVDLEKRIRTTEEKLARLTGRASERRAERREQGFDLVAIAGYTNAGKSTLLHRLADALAVDTMAPAHDDLDGVAEAADRLFETLDTTMRRATLGSRPALLTDTVGLVDGIPHDLVASFSATLDAVADSDAALLVVDASDPLPELREKLRVSVDTLDDPRGELLVALNKADLVDDTLDARRDVVTEIAGDRVADVLAVSALEGTGIDALREAVVDALPTAGTTFDLPNTGETQSFLAWAHENGSVDAAYDGDRVRIEFTGRPETVERARSRVAVLREH